MDSALPPPLQSALKDKIQKYLINGATPEATAVACGCSPSYIVELQKDSEFMLPIQAANEKRALQVAEADDLIDELRATLLSKLKKATATMHKPGDILKSLQVVGALKKERTSVPQDSVAVAQTGQAPTYIMHIPIHLTTAKKEFVFDGTNMAVEVAGKTLVPMPSAKLLELTTASPLQELPNDTQRIRQAESESPPIRSKKRIAEFEEARARSQDVPPLESL